MSKGTRPRANKAEAGGGEVEEEVENGRESLSLRAQKTQLEQNWRQNRL